MVAEIITGKPIPPMKRRGAQPKYPWITLQPGDAFRFADDVTYSGARSMASQHMAGSLARAKLIVRQTEDGIYCWRVDGTPYELQNGNYSETPAPIQQYGAAATPAKQAEVMGYEPRRPQLTVYAGIIPADRMPPEKEEQDPI